MASDAMADFWHPTGVSRQPDILVLGGLNVLQPAGRAAVATRGIELQDVPRGMLAAAALLIRLASLIGLAGLATVAAALATACRRWYRRADLAPADLARLKWEQTKAVAAESGGAWRETELAKHTPRSAGATR